MGEPRQSDVVGFRATTEHFSKSSTLFQNASMVLVPCTRELVDVVYPDAPIIRVVMDNLSTHSAGARYDAFPAPEARRVLKRLEFHHTPKHASWLNMVEIEIGALRSQCLDRRIDNKDTIVAEVAAWEQRRNAHGAKIQWMLTTENARQKLRKPYPAKEAESL